MDVDGVDMLDDHLSGYELLDRLLAAAIPGGYNQSVGHGPHFIPDVIGSGRVFDSHAISQFQQAAYEVVGQHLDAALPGPFLDGTVLRGVGEEEPGMMKTLKPGTRYTASRMAMAASQVWVRGQATSSFPLTVWRVRTLRPTYYRPPLTSRATQPRPSSQTPKSNSEASEADFSSSTSASLLRWGSSPRRSGGN